MFSEAELIELQVSPTAMSELVQGLTSSGGLTRLSLSDCALGDDGVLSVLPVARGGALSTLELRSNKIGNHGASGLAEALAGNSNLRAIDLQKNDIKDQGAIALAAALQVNGAMQVVNMRFNEIGDAGATALGKALQSNRSILELHLGGNLVGPEGAMQLARCVPPRRVGSLPRWRLRGASRITPGWSSRMALTACARGQRGLGHLVYSLSYHRSPNMCHAPACLTSWMPRVLLSSLESNSTLRTLNLRSNAILDVGAVAIARMCKRNDSLIELYLGANGIGEEGCAALADSWKVNSRLQKVDLQGASAGRTGALAVAEALKVNRTLRQLVLEIEPGNREGAAAVANALRSNTTITELALGEAGALDEGILAAVNGTLRVNKFITTIGNGGPPSGAVNGSAEPVAASSAFATAAVNSTPALPPPQLPLGPSPQRPPQRSPQLNRQGSLGASLGAPVPTASPGAALQSPRKSCSTVAPGTGRCATSAAAAASRSKAGGGGEISAGAITGINTRMEQLAAAMEVRLQAQEAQLMRVSADLHSERTKATALETMVAELSAKQNQSQAEIERLREELAERGREGEQLRQELRWVDEAAAKARSVEEHERREADNGLHAQIQALGEAQSRQVADAEGAARAASESFAETHKMVQQGMKDAETRLALVERSAAQDAQAIRAEMAEVATAREAEMVELAEAQAAAQQKLSDELRWVDEEHMRCRAEDDSKVTSSVEALRQETSASIAEIRGQVVEAIVPLGEPGALQTLQQALLRVDTLGEAVAQLCSYMQSLKIKEVRATYPCHLSWPPSERACACDQRLCTCAQTCALTATSCPPTHQYQHQHQYQSTCTAQPTRPSSFTCCAPPPPQVSAAAEARLADLEDRLALGGGSSQMEQRLAALEVALEQEKQSSLKALQAILEHSAAAEQPPQ